MENYKESLRGEIYYRYIDKIGIINGTDPYKIDLNTMSKDAACLPKVNHGDIVNYSVFTKSAYTMEQFKSYKSLEAYNQMICGWVSNVASADCCGKKIVRAKVRHSQSLSLPPLQPWVVAESTGEVLTAHCNCMAGLGETCTHVSALLFTIDALVRQEECKTVTDKPAYWVVPQGIDAKITPKPISELDFTSKKTLKRKIDCILSNKPTTENKKRKLPSVPVPTEEENNLFYAKLNELDIRPAILAIVPPYSDQYIPSQLKENTVWLASDLKCDSEIVLSTQEVDEKCERFLKSDSFNVTEEQVHKVEQMTKDQSQSNDWYRYRAGRITASNVEKVFKSKLCKPAVSTVKAICYPNCGKIHSSAINWGCSHESDAVAAYMSIEMKKHVNLKVSKCGFVISCENSFIGASPDAILSCDCCGKGVLEVKCPYCLRDRNVIDGSVLYESLEERNGGVHLRTDHAHFFQIQTQMYVCKVNHGYYVVWSPKDVFIEKINVNLDLIERVVIKCKEYFRQIILPELVASVFSQPQPHSVKDRPDVPAAVAYEVVDVEQVVDQVVDENNNDFKVYCFCQEPYNQNESYIGCDDGECPYEWFHTRCVNVQEIPDGKWFCPHCIKT